jgi:VRR-NUC domain
MPDLCLWKYTDTEKKCLFSEVKGPGDRLSETQENWIDFLTGLGGILEVELCHLREVDDNGDSVHLQKGKNLKTKVSNKKG